MATAQAALTPTADTKPVTVSIPAKELSGAQWVDRFPGSASTSELTSNFRAKVDKFIAAINAAGGSVSISATYRPKERAYLMHYSSAIANEDIAADKVPVMSGVEINWVHPTPEASVSAATRMATKYGIAYPPVLVSRHSDKTAIDMTISGMIGKKISKADGISVEIKKLSDLNAVGDTYGVIKLVSDPPHWSEDGH